MRVRHPVPPFRRSRNGLKGRPKGRAGLLGHARHLMWSWWIWIAAAAALEIHGNWRAATASAAVGFVFYLLTPPEHIPEYGLETELSVRSQEFLSSIVGATGVSFVNGNKMTVLNNGDAFFPAMLEAIRGAQRSVTME